MKKQEVLEFLRATGGKIFTVVFVKVGGEERVMNCRLGVRKNITGKGMAYDPIARGLLPVYDMQKRSYRMIRLNTVREIRFAGKVIEVSGE
jgi:hypothetical protein